MSIATLAAAPCPRAADLDGSAAAVADDAWCDDVSAALTLLPCAGADAAGRRANQVV